MEELIAMIKNDVAKEFGATIEMPTLWDYAMQMTHRKKSQLKLYEEVIRRLYVELMEFDNPYILLDWMDGRRTYFDIKEAALREFNDQKSKAIHNNTELDLSCFKIIDEFNNIK
jgi:hypothetical protein